LRLSSTEKLRTHNKYWYGFYYIYLKSDRIFRIFFCHHQFPVEIDETQSTFGGKGKLRVTNILHNCGHLFANIKYLAECNWAVFVSSANKEEKIYKSCKSCPKLGEYK
jgi:hypothetical protein